MKEYEAIAQNTRNLEQEYISQIVGEYDNHIGKLQKQIETMRGQHATALDDAKTVKDLRETIGRLEKQRSADEQKLREYESVVAGLRQTLAELSSQKPTGAMPGGEGMEELKSMQEEILKGIRQLASSTERRISGLEERAGRRAAEQDSMDLVKRLRSEIEVLQDKNESLQNSAKLLKEQKDSIVLLKDSLENKDKIIESQRQQIQRLNEKLKKDQALPNTLHFEERPADPFSEKENVEPWALARSESAPKTKKGAKGKSNEKIVNVGNIIREENKSFFNNLSFNNSSPVLEKKAKKKF